MEFSNEVCLSEGKASLAEVLGRLILQDPTFTVVFNNMNREVRYDPSSANPDSDQKDVRNSLKQRPPGLWTNSIKYPDLCTYFCYMSPRPYQMHKSLFAKNKFHNVMAITMEQLPLDVRSNLVIPQKYLKSF